MRGRRSIAYLQGFYYLVSGIWPLVSPGTFQMITGPKTDLWLVNTVASLTIAIGLVLIVAAARNALALEIALLGFLTAASLTAIDVYYVLQKVILPVYLADGVLNGVIAFSWVALAWRFTRPPAVQQYRLSVLTAGSAKGLK